MTGEFRVDDVVVTLQCADTEIDGVLILGGEMTVDPTGMIATGELLVLVIREGDPDNVARVAAWDRAPSLRGRPGGGADRRAA